MADASETMLTEIESLNVSSKWKIRFAFFEKHGGPGSSDFTSALKELSFSERLKVRMNFWAFFFGPLYFLCIGLWKRALVLLAAIVAFVILTSGAPALGDSLDNILGIAIGLICALTANHAYYEKVVKKEASWNPFRGFSLA